MTNLLLHEELVGPVLQVVGDVGVPQAVQSEFLGESDGIASGCK